MRLKEERLEVEDVGEQISDRSPVWYEPLKLRFMIANVFFSLGLILSILSPEARDTAGEPLYVRSE